MISTVMSVASYSVVLAESFAAVGLSTLIPAGFVTMARFIHEAAALPAGNANRPADLSLTELTDALNGLSREDTTGDARTDGVTDAGNFRPPRPQDAAARLLTALAKSTDHIDLLVPKKATIDAKFEFSGSERYSYDVSMGGMIEVVTVKGGYSALFECKSSNEIKLHVDFEMVSSPL